MKSAPHLPDESARLTALRELQILDTPGEEDFDRITRLAARLCGTSMALLTLVDEKRQWFKSRVAVERTETPRDWSFCAHAIAGRDIFEVPDARNDPRFADNPLVENGEIRFYAGAPLVTAAGHALGTVSVLDPQPRKLSAEQREALSALAQLALRQLEMRRAGGTLAREMRDRDFALQFCLALGAAEGLDAMLEIAATHLAEHFEATAAIWLVDDTSSELELRSAARREPRAGEGPAVDARNAAVGEAVERIGRSREGWSTETAPADAGGADATALQAAGAGAFTGMPLVTQRELLGVLAVFRAKAFGREALRSCPMLATMLGLAISARRDEDRLRQANAELERLANERSGALAETERRHQMLLANLPGMAYRCRNTREWSADFVSEGSRGLIGFAPETLTSGAVKYGDLIHPDDVERVWQEVQAALNQRKAFALEYRLKHADGDWRWVWEHGRGIDENGGEIEYIEGFVTDISARKQGEGQALRAQRLESLGTLAGGVAHDLNNALAPILMGLELIRAQSTVSDQLINTMMASARRGADMVRQLLMFARGAEGTRRLISPKHVMQEMEQIVCGSFPKNIAVEVDYPRNVPAVFADPTQLHQVLLNLCVNARDAMPDGGKLRLAIELAHIDPSFASSVPDAQPGNYVVWRVSDTGTGIAPEIIDRIFEPFFSTKGLEKGTGLGLSTALGIVRSHGGFVRVESTPGQGSTFSVYLRAADGAECAVAVAAEPPLRGNGEHILVVDDEPAVRHVSQSVLTALNFRVVLARDGTEALLKAAAHQDELRVVITDLQMPHMDGLTFVRVIRRLLPKAGIIVASGRLDDRAEKEFAALGVKAVLHKPFTQDRLTSALRTVLAESE